MKSSRLLALPLLLSFTSMAHAATTNIDVLFMVSQSTFDTYGHEAVFKSLNKQLDQASDNYGALIAAETHRTLA